MEAAFSRACDLMWALRSSASDQRPCGSDRRQECGGRPAGEIRSMSLNRPSPDRQRATMASAVAKGSCEVLAELKPIPQEDSGNNFRRVGEVLVAAVRSGCGCGQGIRPAMCRGIHLGNDLLENVAYIINRPDFASLTPKFFILRGNETLYAAAGRCDQDGPVTFRWPNLVKQVLKVSGLRG